MIKKLISFLFEVRDRQRIAIALSKGALMKQSRDIDLTNPSTWEFSGFSQNGEDGILDVLRKQLLDSNRYFIEIGSAEGIENNSAWLLIAEKYNGICIEGNPRLVERAKRSVIDYSIGAECYNMFVTTESVSELVELALHKDPDIFSLDIDGNDYYIAKAIMDGGIRPKIFVVEFNSVYGPERSMTIQYQEAFSFKKAHPTNLYYGVSIQGWKNFFAQHNYRFVTIDRNGVNGFFVDPLHYDSSFLDAVNGLDFAENQAQYKRFRVSNEQQFEFISDQKYFDI